MTPQTRATFDDLRRQTTDLLSRQGEELMANQVFHCTFGGRCSGQYCPRCCWTLSLTIANHSKAVLSQAMTDYEAATGTDLHLFGFTVSDSYVPVDRLREVADRMTRKLAKMIGKRSRTILGSAAFFESTPAKVRGESSQEDHPHLHVLIATHDPSSLSMRAFEALPHFESMSTSQAASWVTYGCKARPDQFASHWTALMTQPATFIERIGQMGYFQQARYSGLFRQARAA